MKVVLSLRYSGYLTNTSYLRDLITSKKVFFLKKNQHVSIRDFKKQKNLIFWIVTRVSARDYTVCKSQKKSRETPRA